MKILREVPKLQHDRQVNSPLEDCGDDAFFLAGANQTLTVGVADGVSSWARYGINPALFAWELMVRCEGAAMSGSLDAGEILSEGFETAIRENARQIVGSSTACIASLDCSAGELEVANLGDSGALVVQPNGHVCLETKEQQHYFNCPYQLVCVPPRRSGGSAMSSQGDLPASSEKYATDVRPGDVLILATDGFFDNVWKEQAVSVVLSMASAPAAEIADRLVRVAYAASQSLNETPFGRAAAQHGIRRPTGIKESRESQSWASGLVLLKLLVVLAESCATQLCDQSGVGSFAIKLYEV
ncbi:pptc7 [Symbiodinium sp. CCMP2456]|nr:pptc7 [Symbiodinium sp. CCMP2456]